MRQGQTTTPETTCPTLFDFSAFYFARPLDFQGTADSLMMLEMVVLNNLTRSPKELRVNSPRGEADWAIYPWPLRAKGLIVLVSPN